MKGKTWRNTWANSYTCRTMVQLTYITTNECILASNTPFGIVNGAFTIHLWTYHDRSAYWNTFTHHHTTTYWNTCTGTYYSLFSERNQLHSKITSHVVCIYTSIRLCIAWCFAQLHPDTCFAKSKNTISLSMCKPINVT